MIRFGELEQALSLYTCLDNQEKIPIEYYQRVVKAWIIASNKNLCWDVQQAASILLFLAFTEGVLHPSQLNADGLKTLDFAEKLLQQIKASADQETIDTLRLRDCAGLK